MVNRKALLIGSPGKEDTSDYLEGVARDLQNYNHFLRSPVGGAWLSREIFILDDPSSSAIVAAAETLKLVDYSFVLFSGHGYHSPKTRSTVICLRNNEELNSDKLRGGAGKHTLILDCCRVVERARMAEDALARLDKAAVELNEGHCRQYYDQRISECPPGQIVLHSCDLNETSGDDSRRGGYYAYSLIDGADTWAENEETNLSKHFYILSVPKVHDRAREAVRRLSGNRQNPQIEKPRSEKYFPFAILA